MTAKGLMALMVLASCVTAVYGVSCRECHWIGFTDKQGSGDEECKDPTRGDFAKECDGDGEYCATAFYGSGEVDGAAYDEGIDRNCGTALKCTSEGESDGESETGKYKLYCCKGDNCNSVSYDDLVGSGAAPIPFRWSLCACLFTIALIFTNN